MFKLESYITPILLSYVDKYIKDFRPEDYQVSLWGGDASFHNLDLRLEALEEVLHLPFSFVSGHVHELMIHVPWTKITSEPITITIDTIECKLKLKNGDCQGSDSTSNDSNREAKRRNVKTKEQEVAAPPGYMQSMVNKIVNNISINCNNIIFKYVEEDIVVSVNIRMLKLSSADNNWNPAFTDISPGQIFLRKLVSVTDLTVCLDQTNPAGKIEVYLEPILYRCSLEIRILQCYHSASSKKSSTTRIDLHCSSMEFSMTQQQMPMLIRLMMLAISLQNQIVKPDTDLTLIENEDSEFDEFVNPEEESWAGWAWSFVPSIFPYSDENWNSEQQQALIGHTFHLSTYIDNISFTFKVSECINESSYYIHKKLKYWPFLKLNIRGSFISYVNHGTTFKNIQGGMSEVILFPQGNCSCGFYEVIEDFEPVEYLKVGAAPNTLYKMDSLFDVNSVENKGQRKMYNICWNAHINSNSEAILLERSPAFAIDFLYDLELPEDFAIEKLSEFGPNLEYSNLAERTLRRFVLGPLNLKICSGLIHRCSTLYEAGAQYDYSSYYVSTTEPQLHELKPATAEDYDALNENIPRIITQLTAFKPKFEIYLIDHPYFHPMKGNLFRKRRKSLSTFAVPTNSFDQVPRFTIECQCIDAKLVEPQYPNRLIYTTCQLPTAPSDMFNACFMHFNVQVLGLASQLIIGDKMTSIVSPNNASLVMKNILKRQFWINSDISHMEIILTSENFLMQITKAKLLVILYTIQSYSTMDNVLKEEIYNTSLLTDASKTSDSGFLELSFSKFKLLNVKTNSTMSFQMSLEKIQGFIFQLTSKARKSIFRNINQYKFIPPKLEKSSSNHEMQKAMIISGPEISAVDEDSEETQFLIITVQYPIDINNKVHVPLLAYEISELKICFDPLVCKWLLYQPKCVSRNNSDLSSKRIDAAIIETPRRIKNPQDSVHSSSDRDQFFSTSIPIGFPSTSKPTEETVEFTKMFFDRIIDWYSAWGSAIVSGKISHCTIYFPTKTLSVCPEKDFQDALEASMTEDKTLEIMVVKLPTFTIRNTNQRQSLRSFITKFPVKLPDTIWSSTKSYFPWTVSILELTSYTLQNGMKIQFLKPVSCNATIGLSVKFKATDKDVNKSALNVMISPFSINSKNAISSMAVCVHFDTTPICMAVSEKQVCLMSSILLGLNDVIAKLYPTCINKLPPPPPRQICVHQRVPTVASTPSISMFRESTPETASENSPPNVGISASFQTDDDQIKLSAWFQWTIARLRIKLYSYDFLGMNSGLTNRDPNLKIVFDAEDIMTSVDVQKIYVKVKSKIMSANIYHYKRSASGRIWEMGPYLGIIMKGQDDTMSSSATMREDQDGFLNVTVTRARCGNVHQKWGAATERKSKLSDTKVDNLQAPKEVQKNNYITEVVVALQPIDILVSLSTLRNFLVLIEPILATGNSLANSSQDQTEANEMFLFNINNRTLPLVYVDCRELRFILPSNELINNKVKTHDVCIFQIMSINLTPNAENPICRTPIRSDLYQQAARSRTLNIPGSDIEDRQYQLNFSTLTFSTGKWNELELVLKMRGSLASTLRTMNENPALEWNNLDDGRLNTSPTFNSVYIISRLDICIIFAPAIVSNQDILICGHSVEVNCTSDLDLKISTDQIYLATALADEYSALFEPIVVENVPRKIGKLKSPYARYNHSNRSEVAVKSEEDVETKPQEYVKDSGIDIADYSSDFASYKSVFDQEKEKSKDYYSFIHPDRPKLISILHVPVDILITAGNISMIVYQVESGRYKVDNDDRGYEASEEGSVEEIPISTTSYQPLIYTLISQLNIFMSRLTYDRRLQLSFYNVKTKINLDHHKIVRDIPTEENFETYLLETRRGQPNLTTGIYPAFLTVKLYKRVGNKIEAFVDVARPLKINLSLAMYMELYNAIDKIVKHIYRRVRTAHRKYKITPAPTTNIDSHYVKYREIKDILWGITTLNMQFTQIVVSVNSKTNHEIIFGCEKLESHLSIRNRPEKISTNFSFESVTLSTVKSNISCLLLNPWTFVVEMSFFWEPWQEHHSDPQIQISVDSICIKLEVGVLHLTCLENIYNDLEELFPVEPSDSKTLAVGIKETSSEFVHSSEKDQHYKDDLRAGAFQFIDSNLNGSLEELPLPYQVVFSKTPQTAMAWRYPQPRSLTKVRVFPVPFKTNDSDLNKNLQVLCCIEYWSEVRSAYQPFAKFRLSESEMYQLDLPRVHPQPAISCIWRVVLETQEENRIKPQTLLSPRALAACIRIDSYFNPQLVPRIQFAMNLTRLHFSVLNYIDRSREYKMPEAMIEYTPDKFVPESYRFVTLAFERVNSFVAAWSPHELFTDINGKFRCDILDYTFLTRQTLIEETLVQIVARMAQEIKLQFLFDPIRVKFDPSTGHSIAVCMQMWSQSWLLRNASSNSNPQPIEMVVLTRYVVCNDTNVNICFGQAATDEDIMLPSRHCHMYCWRTQKCKQLMRVAIEENGWNWSIPFEIGTDGTRVCVINERTNYFLILTVKSLSTTQKQIIFSGQLVVYNMLNEQFEFRVISSNEKDVKVQSTHCIAGKTKYPACFLSNNRVSLRIRYYGLDSAWSGDIPMVENKNCDQPWLVKVPLHERGQFLSVWCRVITQDMGPIGQRILAMFWPLFMIRSNLPVSAKVNIETPTLEVILETTISGRGKLQQLYCPGTTDHSHQLTFRLESSTPSNPYVPLNYSLVNQKDFFKKETSYDIDEVLESLVGFEKTLWPFSDSLVDTDWQADDQPLTHVQVFEVRYDNVCKYSSSLLVELLPWCLLLNTTGCTLAILLNEHELCRVAHYGVVTPPKFTVPFSLGVGISDFWYVSSPIELEQIPEDGSITSVIPCDLRICKLLIDNYERNEMRIISISSSHTITNHTEFPLQVSCVVISNSDQNRDIPSNLHEFSVHVPALLNRRQLGVPILQWMQLTAVEADNLLFYIFVSLDDRNEFSCPINVSEISRRSINVSCGSKSVPLVVTVSNYRGQMNISIHRDKYPQLIIENKCKFPIVCAEKSLERNRVFNDEIEHFNWNCFVKPSQTCSYTMPSVLAKFPDMSQSLKIPYLIIAVLSPEKPKNLSQMDTSEWSQAISVTSFNENFVRTPSNGDLKVTVDVKCHTTYVTVDTVSQIEFSAGDVRSRLIFKANELKSQSISSTPDESGEDVFIDSQEEVTSLEPDYQRNSSQLTVIKTRQLSPIRDDSFDYSESIPSPCSKTNSRSHQQIESSKSMFNMKKNLTVSFKTFTLILTKNELEHVYKMTEIATLYLDNLCFNVFETEGEITHTLAISGIQLDNQLYCRGNHDFAVVLVTENVDEKRDSLTPVVNVPSGSSTSLLANSSKLSSSIDSIIPESPSILLKITQKKWYFVNHLDVNEQFSGVNDVHIKLKPFKAYIEDSYVFVLSEYFTSILPLSLVIFPKPTLEKPRTPLANYCRIHPMILSEAEILATPIRLTSLLIEPVRGYVSVHSNIKVFISLDHTRMNFGVFERLNIITTPYRLGHALTMHFLSGAIVGAGWAVGSLGLLGSPAGLARSVGTGLHDFVYLPYEGAWNGPWGFIIGMTQGSASLLRNVFAGTLNSVNNFFTSVARNLDRLSLDSEHLQRTEEARRQRPQGLLPSIVHGISGLGVNILGAVGGLAHHPLQSIVHDGPTMLSIAAGVGKGLVGAIAKPLSGAAELVAVTGQALLHHTGLEISPAPRNPPIVTHAFNATNALVKIQWKMIPDLLMSKDTKLLYKTDGKAISQKGDYEAVTLILTLDCLILTNTEEDIVQQMIKLCDLEIVNNTNDPTLLLLNLVKKPSVREDVLEMDPEAHARVADYVRSAAGLIQFPQDLESVSAQDDEKQGSSSPSPSFVDNDCPTLMFYVRPLARNFFINMLMLSKRQSEKRGFPIL